MKAGFIGLGHIGRGMARELVKAGHDTIVYDLMPEGPAELAALGARIAASPAGVAEASDIIGVSVRTDQDVLDVLSGENGLLQSARPGTVIAIHSTVRPSTIHSAAEMAAAKGVRVVDAPVSRGSHQPEGKTIIYMLGGDEADIEAVKGFVEPSAMQVIVAGGLGAAMALKICNNLVTYLEFLAATEADRLARRTGLDPSLLLAVLTANGNATPTMQAMMKNRVTAAVDMTGARRTALEGFAAIGEKDLDCALEVAAEVGLDLPGAAVARQRIRDVYLGNAE
ncbi:MAG: hypothetical protein JWR80_8712 [Bradyrhizobium sp.]|nr:hypothetical protein [Bradyrhizobium sp.]